MLGATHPLLALVIAAVLAVVLTPVAAKLARRVGAISAPRADRWGGRPTPLLGGLAITLAALVPLMFAASNTTGAAVAIAILAAMVLGLVDDVRGLRPTTKIVGQTVIASFLALSGVRVELIEFAPISFLLTVFWMVGLMNAMNLVDNMDGLAAGIAAIAAAVLVIMAPAGDPWVAVLAAGVTGASVGFLIYNFAPARVYMGDAGSLALGCALGALALVLTNVAASGVGLAVLGPLLALGLPLFDTALVTFTRRSEGRPVSTGGRDHTSHRLAARGLSEREAVVLLYAIAALFAGIGLFAQALDLALLPLAGLALIGLVLFAIFLVEEPLPDAARGRRTVLGSGHVLARFGGEIGLDIVLATIALFSAYLIRFETLPTDQWLDLFVAAAPVVVPIQLATFVVLGVYRTLWSFLGIADVVVILRATGIGTLAAAGAVFLVLGLSGQSRAVFFIDGVILGGLVAGARLFLLWLRHWSALRPRAGDRRVLIIGANDQGEMALRLLLRRRDTAYHPTGFLDDDLGKQRRRIAGVPVLGTLADLEKVARDVRADLVILAIDGNDQRREQVRKGCEQLGIETREFVGVIS